MKKFRINDNITNDISAHAVSVATQFIVCPVGIGDAPQQAKSQGVYHLALLATIVSRKKGHKDSTISLQLRLFLSHFIKL
jgi:hypothetical protein